MSVYDKKVNIKKGEGEFTISVAVSDDSLVVKKMSKKELKLLALDIKKALEDSEE